MIDGRPAPQAITSGHRNPQQLSAYILPDFGDFTAECGTIIGRMIEANSGTRWSALYPPGLISGILSSSSDSPVPFGWNEVGTRWTKEWAECPLSALMHRGVVGLVAEPQAACILGFRYSQHKYYLRPYILMVRQPSPREIFLFRILSIIFAHRWQ